jgi:hypothetical protein
MSEIVLIATFGLGQRELERLRAGDEIYAHLCDRMTVGLGRQLLAAGFTRLLCPIEDFRTGEGFSVRVAFRLSDLSSSPRTNLGEPWEPWELLEVGEARKIYGTDSVTELAAALDRADPTDSRVVR